jgi:hypothetical protein
MNRNRSEFIQFCLRLLAFFDRLAYCVIVMLVCSAPFTMMHGMKGPNNWQAVGYYGVYLFGAAAAIRTLFAYGRRND